MNRSAKYVTAIVVAHLLVNIAHGLAHRELRVGFDPPASIFVTVVVLVSPLIALALVWTTKKRIGLILLSLSMFGSLLFGFYHHFLVASPDHIHSQPSGGWGTTFVLTAYLCSSRRRLEHTSAFIFSGVPKRLRAKALTSDSVEDWKPALIASKSTQSRIIDPVTSFISMLTHLGGVGVFILAALDSSVLPTLGAVDALTIVLAARHQSYGPITPCAARQARSAGLQSLIACRVLVSSIDVSRGRYSTESRHSYIVLEAFLCRSPQSFRHHFRLPLS